jgi:hypothetical protein
VSSAVLRGACVRSPRASRPAGHRDRTVTFPPREPGDGRAPAPGGATRAQPRHCPRPGPCARVLGAAKLRVRLTLVPPDLRVFFLPSKRKPAPVPPVGSRGLPWAQLPGAEGPGPEGGTEFAGRSGSRVPVP